MDLITVIGFISSLVTIEEAGRSLGSCIFDKLRLRKAKKKIVFIEWDTEEESVQRIIDAFKNNVKAAYKEHIFSQIEIEEIARSFFEERSDLQIAYFQKQEIRDFIFRTMNKYNEYNRSQMTLGERILQDTIENEGEKIGATLDVISEKVDAASESIAENRDKIGDLKNSETNNNMRSFLHEVHISKTIGLATIENKINGDYEIDRSILIGKIKRDNHRFISIQGNAGCGKSAMCKTLVCDEKYLLFARAEELAQASRLDDVWGCKLELIFQELSEQKIVIFIDALEFIADCNVEKFRVLQELYDVAKGYACVYIVTSCRTNDRNAFLKLHTQYDVETYEIGDISDQELRSIIHYYPVIGELCAQESYFELLKSPFYINLVVTNGVTASDISDENAFRKYIWNNIICLNRKASLYGIDTSDVRNTINTIVFVRAQKFLLGIHEDGVNSSILHALNSEGIVSITGERVRLKYDIFEDICFEQFFDKVFDESRGNLCGFYEKISSLGACVYRRYQIWIANKLFIQSNRDKFISKLLFSEEADERWKKQTEIGIVKSKYCGVFFKEYVSELRENNLLNELLQIINLYAFEARLIRNNSNNQVLKLLPTGKARECMILLVYNEKLHITDELRKDFIVKMCLDFTKADCDNTESSSAACCIMEYYIDKEIEDKVEGWYYSSEKCLGSYLTVVYQFAEFAKEWLEHFFDLIKDMYLSQSQQECRWASDISVWTFENAYPALTKCLGEELCELANCIFFEKGKRQRSNYRIAFERDAYYGLSDNSNRINTSRHDGLKVFLWNLFRTNFKVGLEWAIAFTNRSFDNLAQNSPESVMEITIYFPDKNEKKQYWGNGEMWLCRVKEHQVPTILSDIIYYAKEGFIEIIESIKQDQELGLRLAKWVKTEIYEKSNNIAMLSVIEEIGLHFQDEFPGYALELASSFELISWDINRYALYNPNPTMRLLEKHIMQIVGLPDLKDRYALDKKCNCNLYQYVSKTQLISNSQERKRAETILDYLYSIVDDGSYDIKWKIQAAKMDMRNPTIKALGNGYYEISATLPEEAKEEVEEQEIAQEKTNELNREVLQIITEASKGIENLRFDQINEVIDKVISVMQKDDLSRIQNENNLVQLIVLALCDKNIGTSRRDYLCNIWIAGINKYFVNESFAAEIEWLPILFKQLDHDLSEYTKAQLKRLLLNSIISNRDNGQIDKISRYAWQYLSTNKVMAKAIFVTILKLAEDEMNNRKINAEYVKAKADYEDLVFVPNTQKALISVDYHLNDDSEERGYKSKKEDIIERYLMQESQFDLSQFAIENFDISTLCFVSNCGLTLDDGQFYMVIKQVLLGMIAIWNEADYDHHPYDMIDTYVEYEVIKLFQRELVASDESFEKAIQILFEDIDFSKFKRDTVQFYLDVFEIFISSYFDAYQDNGLRVKIEKRIQSVENWIIQIDAEYVRIQLYKAASLIISKFYFDWSKCTTSYSNKDKRFLNRQFAKYGKYHVSDFIGTLYEMHIDKLLPEILLSVNSVFTGGRQNNPKKFMMDISKNQWIVDKIILDAFVYNSDVIKKDEELSNAYIHILEMLIEMNNEKAAVLLDEFLIH